MIQITGEVLSEYETGSVSANDGIIGTDNRRSLVANSRVAGNDYCRLTALANRLDDQGANVNWGLGTCNDGYGRHTGRPWCDAQVRCSIACPQVAVTAE